MKCSTFSNCNKREIKWKQSYSYWGGLYALYTRIDDTEDFEVCLEWNGFLIRLYIRLTLVVGFNKSLGIPNRISIGCYGDNAKSHLLIAISLKLWKLDRVIVSLFDIKKFSHVYSIYLKKFDFITSLWKPFVTQDRCGSIAIEENTTNL